MDHFVDRERINALVIMTKACVLRSEIGLFLCALLTALSSAVLSVMLHRYKTLPLVYIANELSLDEPTAAHEFLAKYSAAHYVPEAPKPDIPSKPISISLSAQPRVLKHHNMVKKIEEEPVDEGDKRQLDCKLVHPYVVAASQTFQKVDIKGQI